MKTWYLWIKQQSYIPFLQQQQEQQEQKQTPIF